MNNQKKPVIVGEFLKYEFTEEEVRQKSKDLALAVQEQTTAQEEQKAAQAQFKERIEGCQSRIGRLSRQINMGWEMRTIDCRVLSSIRLHRPQSASSAPTQARLFARSRCSRRSCRRTCSTIPSR